jgi:t-SNARE complex subunit (syntaxin)
MVETHKDCPDITIIENIVKDVKKTDIFNEIEQLISGMIEAIDKIRENRETISRAVRTYDGSFRYCVIGIGV